MTEGGHPKLHERDRPGPAPKNRASFVEIPECFFLGLVMDDAENTTNKALCGIARFVEDDASLRRFVSKRTACALLDLSESGFRAWLHRGLLPPAVAGSPADERRWDWLEIVAWMHGDRSSAQLDLLGDAPPIVAGKQRGPAPGAGGRPRKPEAITTNGEHHVER